MNVLFLTVDYDLGFNSNGHNIYVFMVLNEKGNRTFRVTSKTRKILEGLFASLIFESDHYTKNSGKYNTFYFNDCAEEAQFVACMLEDGLDI